MGTLFPAHFAPGRVCVRIDFLRGRPQLAPISGIHRLEIDPSNGTCLVVYDSRTVASPAFIDAVSRPLAALLPQSDVMKIISRTGLGRGVMGSVIPTTLFAFQKKNVTTDERAGHGSQGYHIPFQ
jgi:hypothetical protein